MKLNLLKQIENKQIISKNEPVVVALSGGVDSMVLFHILYSLNKNLIIAHVNHNKRKASVNEYKYIEKMAKQFNVPFEGYTLNSDTSNNFQEDARLKRYDFFKAIAQKHQSTKIAVAHHLDDQVETVLMRIVRGTSFRGYSGIKSIRLDRNLAIIRPLMDTKKNEIIQYAIDHDIKYFEDASNQEDYYTRNRFRNNIIPLLKKENPNLDNKVIQLAEYIDYADEILEEKKKEFLRKYTMYNHASLLDFNDLNKVIKIKVLEHMVNQATNNSVEVSYEQFKSIIEICHSDTPNQLYSLSNDFNFVKEYEVIYIGKAEKIEPINIIVEKNGEYFVSDNKSYVFTDKKLIHNYSNYFELCYNKLVFPLYIRQRQNGDKMSLKVGTKKVKDILIDQKIPKTLRNQLLLVANDDTVLWIPGIKKSIQDCTLDKILYIYEVE